MQQAAEFLKRCKIYYLLTDNQGKPEGRPFGSFLEYEGCLFFATSTTKQVYFQLKENPNVQIVAKDPHSQAWIRISGQARESNEIWIKEEMIETFPRICMLFDGPDDPTLALFRVANWQIEYS